jgi:cation-transporting P-type ATPase E
VGLDGGPAVDARTLPPVEDVEAFATAIDERSVFGRVTPEQKRAFVKALQSRGHVVAMTGDGVNDALALKDADMGIAMGNGAPATRAVAQLVLLDGRFASMPGVVAEGRRVIANIERVASLFVIKNVYATVMAVVVSIAGRSYPFLPRHLTVLSSLTIGIPAFFLSLAPNATRYQPGFLRRVLTFSVPAGIAAATAGLVTYFVISTSGTLEQARTATTVTVGIVALWVLAWLARPYRPWKLVLVALMAVTFAAGIAIDAVRDFFDFELPDQRAAVPFLCAAAACAALSAWWRWGPLQRGSTRSQRPVPQP